MFTTIENVKKQTGYDVTNDDIFRAQAVLETYLGRVEEDIEDPNDNAIMGKATAYQAAYMKKDYDRVFEQMAIVTVQQSDGGVAPNNNMAAPFIAPLAFFAMRSLSWKRSRSVKTGSMWGGLFNRTRWETE